MAIITAAGLSTADIVQVFNRNGSLVKLKKISETDWLLFGDVAEGSSEGFVVEDPPSPLGDFALIVGDAGEDGVGYASEINIGNFPPTGTLLNAPVGIAGEVVSKWETFHNSEGSLSIWAEISRERPFAETRDALITFHLPEGDEVREFTLNLMSLNYISFTSDETVPDWVVGQTVQFSVEIL